MKIDSKNISQPLDLQLQAMEQLWEAVLDAEQLDVFVKSIGLLVRSPTAGLSARFYSEQTTSLHIGAIPTDIDCSTPSRDARYSSTEDLFRSGQFFCYEDDLEFKIFVPSSGRDKAQSGSDYAVLRRIAPYIARALRIHKPPTQFPQGTEVPIRILDRLCGAVVVTCYAARILYLNARSQAIFSRRDGIHHARGELILQDPHTHNKLRELLSSLASSSIPNVQSRSLHIQRSGGKQPYVMLISPLDNPNLVRTANLRNGRVILTIDDPDYTHSLMPEALRDLYNLTPSESRIVGALTNGYSIDEIADQRSVSPDTVRTQLKRIFRKTGVKRQIDLVRLILRHPAFLIGD